MPDDNRGPAEERPVPSSAASATRQGADVPTSEAPANDWRRDFARYGGLGMQLAAAVGVLAYLGLLLDRWLGTLPLFVLIGVALGSAGGFLALIKKVPLAGGRKGRDPSRSKTDR